MVEENLIREFIAEAEEHLLTLEPNLLRLEREPSNHELMNEIFLATHSIKGTASYVGLSHISSFTHTLESVLDPLRKGLYHPSPELIDVLLQGIDTLKELITYIAQGKPAPDTSVIVTHLVTWQKYIAQNIISEVPTPDGVAADTITHVSVTAASTGSEQRAELDDIVHFDPHTCQLEREDCEIFADISSQQLELIRFTVGKIHEVFSEGEPASSNQVREHVTTLLRAFHKIQSSAAMLNTETLDGIFEIQERRLSPLENPEHALTEDDLKTIAHLLASLDAIITSLAAYAAEESPAPPPPSPPEVPLPISSRSVEFSRGRYTLRVDAERVDYLLNLVGELVINRARFVQIGKEIKTMYEDLRTGELTLQNTSPLQRKKNIRVFKKLKEHFDEITLDLGRLTNQMQEATMRIRMVPISQVLSQFPRMVRDLSRQAGKEVEIAIYGADTELDKTVIDVIGDPLIHIIRNAIDHGIEMPEERLKHEKPRQGTILLSAFYEGNQVIIEVKDDGRGIDVQRIKHKAIQQQLMSAQEAATLQEHEIASLIFHSGFSTVESVSSLSGRGVGLNVVKRYLEKINGAIELEFIPGGGCTFIIKLPLTLAIIPALMVRVRSEIFAIPLISVEEAIRFTTRDLKTIESHKVIRLRERMIPLLDLAELLGSPVFTAQAEQDKELVPEYGVDEKMQEQHYGVILSDGFREIGIIVDALFGESDIVIKPLNNELVNVEGISGASIRGDGQVSLVIDAVSLINFAIKYMKDHHRVRARG